jgi:predicted lipoprotein with Yx(FWY)xxD motif
MDASDPMLTMDSGAAMVVDAGAADLQLLRSPSFDGYLADATGEPLYMFVGDVPGSSETACLDACASAWPPFDVPIERVAPELDLAVVSRFHRDDGAWQVTYKGHPLYRRASEEGRREITGDKLDSRWFVGRDYLAFMGSARTFAPAGGMGTNGPFLTDGFGRTLYVCLDDTPATALTDPASSCEGTCLERRPAFSPTDGMPAAVLPSVLDPAELQSFVRDDGIRQFMYRGWPLYYFSGDVAIGATEGHNDGAWRAFDPVLFKQ